MAKETTTEPAAVQAPAPVVTKKEVPKHNFKLGLGDAVIALKSAPADQVKVKMSDWSGVYEKSGLWELIDSKTKADEKKIS